MSSSGAIERCALTGIALHPKIPILGFARRMTAYKRPDLLFSDLERRRPSPRSAVPSCWPARPIRATQAASADRATARPGTRVEGVVPVVICPTTTWISPGCLWPRHLPHRCVVRGLHQRHEGRVQRRRTRGARRLVVEGCIEGDRLGDRQCGGRGRRRRARSLRQAEQVVLPLYYGYSDDPGGWIGEGRDQQERVVLNSHRSAPLRYRGVYPVNRGAL